MAISEKSAFLPIKKKKNVRNVRVNNNNIYSDGTVWDFPYTIFISSSLNSRVLGVNKQNHTHFKMK
jgi:hypothetical protein